MPPATGLVVGVVATLAAAPFVSSPYLQTGPVAITALMTFGGLSGLAATASADWLGLAGLLAVLVGVIRLAVGVGGVGAVAYVMSRPVIAGFVPAAGLVIALSQSPSMVGVDAGGRGPVDALAVVVHVCSWDVAALGLAVLTVVVMVSAQRVHRLLPAVLLSVVLGMVVAALAGFDGPVLGPLPTSVPSPNLSLPWRRAGELAVPAVVIALVGFAEPAAIARTYAQ